MGSGASVASRMNENSSIHYPKQIMYREFTDVHGFYIQTNPNWTRRIDFPPRPSGAFSSAEPYLYIAFYDEYQLSFMHGPTHSERNSHEFPGPMPFPHVRPGLLPQNQ